MCKFGDSSHPRCKCPVYEKFCHVSSEKNHFKACCPRVGKKVHGIEKDESGEPSDQSDYKLFIEVANFQDSVYINQIKKENSD